MKCKTAKDYQRESIRLRLKLQDRVSELEGAIQGALKVFAQDCITSARRIEIAGKLLLFTVKQNKEKENG